MDRESRHWTRKKFLAWAKHAWLYSDLLLALKLRTFANFRFLTEGTLISASAVLRARQRAELTGDGQVVEMRCLAGQCPVPSGRPQQDGVVEIVQELTLTSNKN